MVPIVSGMLAGTSGLAVKGDGIGEICVRGSVFWHCHWGFQLIKLNNNLYCLIRGRYLGFCMCRHITHAICSTTKTVTLTQLELQ